LRACGTHREALWFALSVPGVLQQQSRLAKRVCPGTGLTPQYITHRPRAHSQDSPFCHTKQRMSSFGKERLRWLGRRYSPRSPSGLPVLVVLLLVFLLLAPRTAAVVTSIPHHPCTGHSEASTAVIDVHSVIGTSQKKVWCGHKRDRSAGLDVFVCPAPLFLPFLDYFDWKPSELQLHLAALLSRSYFLTPLPFHFQS